jgi:hypothetical protein
VVATLVATRQEVADAWETVSNDAG